MPDNDESINTLCKKLFQFYNKVALTKQELAQVLGVSISYIDKSLARGYGVPNYKKLGTASNSKVIFNINDIAHYLSDTTKMV
ncbi:hypothetical protein HUE87_03580 [Candidatus Sulfurimonas marisnigri]|uniref:Uncharacterized protein n=1 Tax=Candidatus Sulfurimonas marisnigri TaxID=2740405 RepID=A0A7S7M1K1_9BACT|nr:hypothetical protein [Candidatus Sulfurimonas marisnigri]QOY55330.1 hypothetical protein HUE87_03580 [Candidatus Sulfurimonas marisnigri]